MKKYFYSNGQDKNGPVTLEHLKQTEITPNTLIWHEGLENWEKAECFEELRDIFELNPPLIDDQNYNSNYLTTNTINYETNQGNFINNSSQKQAYFFNPFSFKGRISRTEYGISLIIYVVLYILISLILTTTESFFLSLSFIPLVWFIWAQGAKRCHDMGQSGWWQIIPFYPIWMIFGKSEAGIRNKYGVNLKN
jgi:hypothetical protein